MALTDTEIRRSKCAEKPYKLSDSGGLHLLVTLAGGKLWRWKYRFGGAAYGSVNSMLDAQNNTRPLRATADATRQQR